MDLSKLRKTTTRSDEESGMDMSPMIDMVFLLLIFFIVNATVIIVKQDPLVNPPVGDAGEPMTVRDGRIVVNVHSDGTFTAEVFKTELADDAAISEYIRSSKRENDANAVESKLHLRGDKDAIFKHSKKVINLAAKERVSNVVFAVKNQTR